MSDPEPHGNAPNPSTPTTPADPLTQTMQDLSRVVEILWERVATLPMETGARLIALDGMVDAPQRETMRDITRKQDRKNIVNWKDEHDTLFVTALLFSAFVTTLAIESSRWLQQDAEDATRLLALTSHRPTRVLAGAITRANPASAGLIHSIARTLPLSNVAPSFASVPYAIPVNVLWILSVVFSLISAFLIFAAPHWLRQSCASSDTPILWVGRPFDRLQNRPGTWQVPSVISLSRHFLQVAVTLFLFGLFLLPQTLSAAVAVALVAVAVIEVVECSSTVIIPFRINRYLCKSSTCLPLNIAHQQRHALNGNDIPALLRFAPRVLMQMDHQPNSDRCSFISAFIALILIKGRTASITVDGTEMLRKFAVYLENHEARCQFSELLQQYQRDPVSRSRHNLRTLTSVNIQQTLCKALADYASMDTLPQDPSHLDDLYRISNSLRNIYSHVTFTERDEIQAIRRDLRRFDVALMPHIAAVAMKNGSLRRARTVESGRRMDWTASSKRAPSHSHPSGPKGQDDMTLVTVREELRTLDVQVKVLNASFK